MLLNADVINQGVTLIKEVVEVGFYAVMSNSEWFAWFGASPFYFVAMPLLALCFNVFALVALYKLIQGPKKEFKPWFDTSAAIMTSILTSISLYGAVLASLTGFSFAAGPFFFLGSLTIGLVHQTVSLGMNLYSVMINETNSKERYSAIQSSIQNLFILAWLAAIVGTAFFVLVMPVSAPLASVFAVTATLMTAVHLSWFILPRNFKHKIKDYLNLTPLELPKPVLDASDVTLITPPVPQPVSEEYRLGGLRMFDTTPPQSEAQIGSVSTVYGTS